MHNIFTTYHTLLILLIYCVVIFSFSKIFSQSLPQIFTGKTNSKLLLVAIITALLSMLYSFQFDSGMNKITVLGWPRGFYQKINTENGMASKSIFFRYLFEDLLLYFGAYSIALLNFRIVQKK